MREAVSDVFKLGRNRVGVARGQMPRLTERSTNARFYSREWPQVADPDSQIPEFEIGRFRDSSSRLACELASSFENANGPKTRACEERALGRDNEPEESTGNDSDGGTGKQRLGQDRGNGCTGRSQVASALSRGQGRRGGVGWGSSGARTSRSTDGREEPAVERTERRSRQIEAILECLYVRR
jgi:hypothetical protein